MKNKIKRVVVKPYGVDRFEVVKDFEVSINNLHFTIPKGFITDGASIPRIFWSIFPPYRSEYFSAVVIHDYLCSKANSKDDYALADETLKEAMIYLNCSKIKVFLFYNSCNIFHKIKCFLKGIE